MRSDWRKKGREESEEGLIFEGCWVWVVGV